MKYSSIKSVSGNITGAKLAALKNCLDDGYEILKLDTHYVCATIDFQTKHQPCIIAILAKPEVLE